MIRYLALALFLATGASVCTTGAPETAAWQKVYEDESWYRERPEPEREWRGTLEPRTVIEGPDSRTALRFALLTGDGAIPVYAPTAALDAFANARVVIRGKSVRINEPELWPGAIARSP